MDDDLYMDEDPVKQDNNVSTVIVVDNVPKTEMKRYEKLCGVIRKIFSEYGNIINEGLYIPVESVNGEQKTSGYAFIEYETEEGANNAVQKGNLRKLDAQHILLVNHYEDIDRFAKVPDTYTPPKQSDYESKVSSNSWLLDELGRDMFVVRAGVETEVYYNDPFRKASDFGRTYKYGGEREKLQDKHWCDLYVGWSPKGSYLCTFHEPGLAIWGGEEFQKLGRFPHGHVQYFEFSPNEKYIVTCNGAEKECYIVWDVRQQKKLRGFERSETQLWPAFKWSHDDKFIARLTKDMISVYETPLMGLLDKKSIKIPNVAEFAWNPTKTQIAYWVPEQPPNVPATVAIVELPSRKIIREKHLYNVIDIKIHWHDHGDFLCVKVTRRKTKKTTTTNFEIFRMKVKEIPIEVTELEANIIAFAWEPQGSRFAIIHAQGESTRCSLSIYKVKSKKIELLKTFENRSCNSLFWSPTGGHLLLAGLGPINGSLEWFDIDNLESLTTNEHFMCNEIEWDPSGRYIFTSVTQPIGDSNWRATMENGYRLWSFQGQLLAVVVLEECYQVSWRPRPPTLLSKEQQSEIKSKLKEKYWRKFDQEDEEIRQSQLSGVEKERQTLKQSWKTYRAEKEKEFADERELRRELRGGAASDNEGDYETVDTVVEEELEREEEVVQKE